MPGAHQVTATVLTGTHQIPGRFLGHAGHRDLHDLTQVQQPGQMRGITGIGLDPIPGRTLKLRRRGHQTHDPGSQQEPRQPEPGRAGLIGHRHRRWQPLDPLQDLLVIRAQPPLMLTVSLDDDHGVAILH